jgi:hypothetical protein
MITARLLLASSCINCAAYLKRERFHYGDLDITVQEMKGPKIEKVLITKE